MKPITGRQVLIFTVGAFGIIVAVNITLAVKAVRTFPGLEVANSYVASQEFDKARAAQLALGWNVTADYRPGVLEVAFTYDDGRPADVASLTALVGWATSTRDDFVPEFTKAGGVFTAPATMEPGNWNIRLKALAPDGTEFKQRVVLFVDPALHG
ncbi:MAG: FixH family protein [Rhodobacteraceae bacterium]|nr:FixH family protein [Paracoccaceae bacterium]